jgi:hypothetical protein
LRLSASSLRPNPNKASTFVAPIQNNSSALARPSRFNPSSMDDLIRTNAGMAGFKYDRFDDVFVGPV